MRRRAWAALAVAILTLTVAIVLTALAGSVTRVVGPTVAGLLSGAIALLAGAVGLAAAIAGLLVENRGAPSICPPERSPERSRRSAEISGQAFAETAESATRSIQGIGTIDEAIRQVRPALRTAAIEVFTATGGDRDAAIDRLDSGAWTDDRTAAAVLAAEIEPPERGVLARIERWLFPERVFRRQVRRAVEAIATAADAELPAVAGQYAPRTVPITEPPLAALRRTVDGQLEEASVEFDRNRRESS